MKLDYIQIFSNRILILIIFVIWDCIECRKIPVQQNFEQDNHGEPSAAYILIPASDSNRFNNILSETIARSDNIITINNKNKGTQKQYRELGLQNFQQQQQQQHHHHHQQQYQQHHQQQPKTKESKNAPVQTIRNYNKVNDDGSFTFGYEAADGSFKEETRGTDCVVRGKYGYIDPDGNKREFTYISGNPCDPNAPKDNNSNEDYDNDNTDNENEQEPENYPKKSLRPTTILRKPPITLFQNVYSHKDENNDDIKAEDEQKSYRNDIKSLVKANVIQADKFVKQNAYISTTPTTLIFQNGGFNSPVEITPRPGKISQYSTPPATTYRPQLVPLSITPKTLYYTTPSNIADSKPTAYSFSTLNDNIITTQKPDIIKPQQNQFNFLNEFHKYNQNNPTTVLSSKKSEKDPIYASQLIFDPQSGQYKTALFQSLPLNNGNFLINQQIQPYVHEQNHKFETSSSSPSLIQYYQPTILPTNQALYQQQQAGRQFRNSQKLFEQQQKIRSIQHHLKPFKQYLIIPQSHNSQNSHNTQNSLTSSQLEDFIRGNNLQL